MKTTIPTHPHTAKLTRFKDQEGRSFHLVAVHFMVPSRVAALLPESNNIHHIPAAGIGDEKYLAHRVKNWRVRHNTAGNRSWQPLKNSLAALIEEGCNARIMLALSVDEWHLVGMLCGKLGITPGQWFLACAGYNANLEEEAISSKLDALQELPSHS